MCGIAGHAVANGRVPNIEAVTRATNNLIHRGPDGGGIASFETACLGHRRLSIIDISDSTQPWFSEDKRFCIVFNGEIYNYLELRKELETVGVSFRSHGDTEVLLQLFILHGVGCLGKLNGMFAFAIWDNLQRTLFIGRDRLGKKPVHYSVFDGGIAFASEIAPLLSFDGIDKSVDIDAVQEFFGYQFIGGSRSIYRGINKLRAGHYLIYSQRKVDIVRYWSPPFPSNSTVDNKGLHEELTSLVDDAVRLRLRSDVPLGAFLSGGLDSSIIVATMKKLGADIDTFTVGFEQGSFDESDNAAKTAHYYGTRHHSSTLDLNVRGILDKCLGAFGEPFADPSAIPTWHLCQQTQQHVTVALSGDGADELFGGYRRYFARQLLVKFLLLPQWARKHILYQLIEILPEGTGYYGNSIIKKLKLFVKMASRLEEAPGDLLPQTFSLSERKRLFSGDSLIAKSYNHVREFGLWELDSVSQMMQTDIHTYLIDDILVKVDRMSMAHSLEVRSPFLDYRIVEFACKLPLEFKIHHREQKHILKYCYRNKLPPNVLAKPKHGFSVPLGSWFRNELKDAFQSLVFDSETPEFLNRKEIMRLWLKHQEGLTDNGFKLWSIFVFHHWYHHRNSR